MGRPPIDFVELDPERWLALAPAGRPVPAALASTPAIAATHVPLAEVVARQQAVIGSGPAPRPYVVGVTGGVAAGKTVTAAALAALLVDQHGLRVAGVSTDGFLWPNAELERQGLLARKGFPESYDYAALLAFVRAVRRGAPVVEAPLYDHATYDIVVGRTQRVERSDVVVVEGLNVLQPAPGVAPSTADAVSGLLDLGVYVDADLADLHRWFGHRVLRLRAEATGDGSSFYDGFAAMRDDEFAAMADGVWRAVNEPNIVDHVVPTRSRADLVLEKRADHSVRRVARPARPAPCGLISSIRLGDLRVAPHEPDGGAVLAEDASRP